jgi:hypothetical protein
MRAVLNRQLAWSSSIEKWTAAQIYKNMWRFDRVETPEDVMQDARLLFHTLLQKYPIVTENAHFFALYKTSLLRMFVDKSRIKQKSVVDAGDELTDHGVDHSNYGYLAAILDEMPEELQLVLKTLTMGKIRLKLDRPTKRPTPRENLNMRLKRQLSLQTEDPVGALRAYLIGD